MEPREGRDASNVEEALALAHRLQSVSERLAEARSPDQVLDAVLSTGLEAAGASRGLIALIAPSGEALEIAASHGYDDESLREWLSFPLSDDFPLSRAVVRGEPVFLRSRQERDEQFPALADHVDEGHALTCLPLIVEGRPIGGLALSFVQNEPFSDERRRFKTTLAHQVAQALERTRLFEREHEHRRRMAFLAGASYLLSSSLDYRETLARVARLAVPDFADWCSVDVLSEDGGRIERLAVAHVDPEMVRWAQELGDRYPPDPDSPYGVPAVLRTHEPQLTATIDDELLVAASNGDEELLDILRRLELRSAITVPLIARERALGALSLIRTGRSPEYTKTDVDLAVQLGAHGGQAIDNALLLREVRRQADAARALEYVADGVVLVDEDEVVRYWNPAASRMTGIAPADAVGRPAATIPGWADLAAGVATVEGAPVAVLPFADGAVERWLAVRAVAFGQGLVYALRDVTADRELERLRSEFVATASHELRTPLAAVYGAIRSLRRTDVKMPAEQQELFLEMIENESERLRTLVDQLLIAGRLDAGVIEVSIRAVELGPVIDDAVRAARMTAPESIAFEVGGESDVAAPADRDLLLQVLGNLVDNAVKYSPGGGVVAIATRNGRRGATLAVSDQGVGIPPELHERIFEKFFRVDPGQRSGVGGTGLGLYIAAELTRRMGGRLTVDSTPGGGSTFTIEFPSG
ncbi:MAG: GAF domain-containing protein [Acidobacteriota bacterium]|nr:GAF domain-containing protein [Acidobacteriota bacterium]MDE3189999.1 GAF domain-containing protein [Acidobacteriota bacterium]